MSLHLQGTGGAPGLVFGYALHWVLPSADTDAPPGVSDPDEVLDRFAVARAAAGARLLVLADGLRNEGHHEEAAIFDAQALLIEDVFLVDAVTRQVREQHVALEAALNQTIAQMRGTLEALDDPYLRERAADIDAIGRAIFDELHGYASTLHSLPPNAIIIAEELTPAMTVGLRGGAVAGFLTAAGGPTSHTIILARALGLPAVVGVGATALTIRDGVPLILDGSAALVIVEPDVSEHHQYAQQVVTSVVMSAHHVVQREYPGCLADGHAVGLWANISHPDEAQRALSLGAEGIGLFRSEFLFLNRLAPPSEEEQFAAYRAVLTIMGERPVVVRTLDVGGDKQLAYLDMPREANPALGVRGLRLCMRWPELFLTQLRALLRAAVYGNLWIMLPMVATLADLHWGRAQLAQADAALSALGTVHRSDVRLGIMVETPAAAITADLLAREAAFLSVGSNDLAQYTLAADRGEAAFARSYPHDAPAVLRLIAQAAAAATHAGIPIGVCGELAGQPDIVPALVGLGVSELSMVPRSIPYVKQQLREITLVEAQALAHKRLHDAS